MTTTKAPTKGNWLVLYGNDATERYSIEQFGDEISACNYAVGLADEYDHVYVAHACYTAKKKTVIELERL